MSVRSQIIVVDDDEHIIETLKDGLSLLGFDCLGFTSPHRAIEQAKWLPPDLMIVDYDMPALTGAELILLIREELQEETPPIIVLSGATDEESIRNSYECGAADFIAKPISLVLLKVKIENLIHARNARTVPELSLTPIQLGSYIIDREIGRGGMGVVYRAHHEISGTPVALKALIASSDNRQALQRFRREASLLMTLNHPHLTQFYEAARCKDVFFYAMEFIDGPCLDEVIARGPIDPKIVARYCFDIADALTHVHELDLIHRDIKPSNVMVCPRKGAVLTDFGLSKACNDTKLTSTNQLVGTPHFMSPEYILHKDLSAKSDIFALGLLCLECLLGRAVFADPNPFHIMQSIVNGEFPTMRDVEIELGLEIPEALKITVAGMLQIDPEFRVSTAAEVNAGLKGML